MNPEDLQSQGWRLRNLYSCREEGSGKSMPFRLRAEQEVLLQHFLEKPGVPVYVVKSRRLGISTFTDTFMLDAAAFGQGFRGLIIDLKQADATKKMVEIVRFAYDSMPRELLERYVKDGKRNDGELRLRMVGEKEKDDSVVYATTGGRGGDCSMLHVSEWGPIAATDPVRSKEIRTGALPAASRALKVVETTWAGGKGGDLWELVKPVLEKDPNANGVVYFFPWHSDPQAVSLHGQVTGELEAYFKDLGDKTGLTFSEGQKKWFGMKKLEQGIFMKREYPSTLEEAFSAPIEGSIYGDVIMARRGVGALCPFEWNRDYPVYTAWDIGWEDSTTIWLWQMVGPDVYWIRYFSEQHAKASEMVQVLNATGIPIAHHYLPHDAAQHKPGEGQSYRDLLLKAGLMNITVLPMCRSRWPGIDSLRGLISRSFFNMPACADGVTALEAYRTKEAGGGGTITREPLHDWSSHAADSARYVAEALALNMVRQQSAKRKLVLAPAYPDGSIVDLDQVQDRRQRSQGLAKSGPTPF